MRRYSRPERAVLVLGPPRSGKTTSVIIPTLTGFPGPAVSTSTKPDVLQAAMLGRRDLGRVWRFDPTGTTQPVDGIETLRWSPVGCAADWDGALLVARAMITGSRVGHGTTDSTHWQKRAEALLAPLLHAAALSDRSIVDVLTWVSQHQVDEPVQILSEHAASPLAGSALVGLQNTESRERSSIFSAASDALDAYRSTGAIKAASDPNFYAGRFVRSTDTIYIHAPAEHQHLVAPLVCGLLAEIRRTVYQAHAAQVLRHRVLLALDEVANIAPLDDLPQIASEGGSQGLLLLAALQDLSQARERWGTAADGFLTLFGDKLLLPGIADQQTLESVSTMLGEYDRHIVSHTRPDHRAALIDTIGRMPLPAAGGRTQTHTTQRTRVLSPGEIANIPAGHALHLDGVSWERLRLTPTLGDHTS